MKLSYPQFFQAATGNDPYDWQIRLAEDPTCQSRLIDIPTGLGKTAGVVLAWLWNRLNESDADIPVSNPWPRRLVYCLPMRTLVEQTEAEVNKWLQRLIVESRSGILPLSDQAKTDLQWLSTHSPIILMGGEDNTPEKRDWDLHPEKPAILIGTQDMLLSRALNRGYGMSRYRWPMHFALLNNDALWVMDEVQLMGPGLATTTQLEGFRQLASLGSQNCHSWWMSATIRSDWLKTVDFPKTLLRSEPLRLLDAEKSDGGRVEALRNAQKSLKKAAPPSGGKNEKAVAAFIAEYRSPDHLNLVVVNTVKRARALHGALVKQLGKNAPIPVLLHSRFRPADRRHVLQTIGSAAGQIVVSTQVIEAGVDLSAHTLFTELAPWSSLVQRFGRCNRWLIDGRPHYADAQIFWFDLDEDKEAAPYEPAQFTAARERLTGLTSTAAIAHLETIDPPDADRPKFRHVVRRKDLLELFDTTPDLAGADLDIDRFVRDAADSNVHVFWRGWTTKTPNGSANADSAPEPAPRREELCSTSIGDLKLLLGKTGLTWRWSHLDRRWQPVKAEATYPGQVYLLHASQGGYQEGEAGAVPLGWTGDPKHKPSALTFREDTLPQSPDSNEDDKDSERDRWQTLAQHTDAVCQTLEKLLTALDAHLLSLPSQLSGRLPEILRQAARWHDWGKAHPAFQAKLKSDRLEQARDNGSLPRNADQAPAAKAPPDAWMKGRLPKPPPPDDDRRKHFRHELASALGVLHPDSGFPLTAATNRDLAAYLIAAHHGKVRLSIRSLPDEWIPPVDAAHPRERRFARGVWDDDTLHAADLGDVCAPSVKLSLEPMELGLGEQEPFVNQPSWAERTLDLRDTLGPFALCFLETILRAADMRASEKLPFSKTPQAVQEDSTGYPSASTLTPEQSKMAQKIAAEGLAIQDRFRPEPLYKETGKGHYESRTVEDIQKARQKKEEPE